MIKEAAIRLEGKVFTGWRHVDILHANADSRDGIIVSSIAAGEHGFVTNEDEFLNREQAAEHALKCGQIEKLKYSKTQLFSEDLYRSRHYPNAGIFFGTRCKGLQWSHHFRH
jgi:hypothetical protein